MHNTTSVTRKDSDQPVHPPSMARVLVHLSLDNPEAVDGHAISKDTLIRLHLCAGWSESLQVGQVLL